jgi:hypothetical protein
MSTRSAARQQLESRSVPSLEIATPRLELGRDGDGVALGTGPGFGLRAALIALLGAVVIAAAVFLLTHRTHHLSGAAASAQTTREREHTEARLALAGARTASDSMLSAVAAQSGDTLAAAQSTPVPHSLSSSDLTTLADGTSLYQPAQYLEHAYQTVAARFNIPWRVLASVEYLQGGYVNAIAGANAGAERTVSAQVQSNGRDVVNAQVLAQATAAAV